MNITLIIGWVVSFGLVIFGIFMSRDVVMSSKEIIGCVIMFCAIILSQLPLDRKKAK